MKGEVTTLADGTKVVTVRTRGGWGWNPDPSPTAKWKTELLYGEMRWGNHVWTYTGWRAKHIARFWTVLGENWLITMNCSGKSCAQCIFVLTKVNAWTEYVKRDFKNSATNAWWQTWQWWQALVRNTVTGSGHAHSNLQKSDLGAKIITILNKLETINQK